MYFWIAIYLILWGIFFIGLTILFICKKSVKTLNITDRNVWIQTLMNGFFILICGSGFLYILRKSPMYGLLEPANIWGVLTLTAFGIFGLNRGRKAIQGEIKLVDHEYLSKLFGMGNFFIGVGAISVIILTFLFN
jgi:hypothetical protein